MGGAIVTGDLINQLVTAFATIAGGTGFWGFIQWARERKGAKSRAAKEQQAQEKADRQSEIDRAKLLADAQAVAQTTALESANKAYEQVTKRCDACLGELHLLRIATENLIDTFEAFLDNETTETRADVRVSIRAARQAL